MEKDGEKDLDKALELHFDGLEKVQRSRRGEEKLRETHSITWVLHPDDAKVISALSMLDGMKFHPNYKENIAEMKEKTSSSCFIGELNEDIVRASFMVTPGELFRLAQPKERIEPQLVWGPIL